MANGSLSVVYLFAFVGGFGRCRLGQEGAHTYCTVFIFPMYRPTLALHWPEMALEKPIAYKRFEVHYDKL